MLKMHHIQSGRYINIRLRKSNWGDSAMAVISYIEAVTMAIREEMERDEKVFVLGEDVGVKGGVFKATQGLYDQFGEQRVIDTPLAESAIAGVGIGAAMYGYRPIAEMQFADFIMPAINQIISEAAKIRYRSNNDWNCPIVIQSPLWRRSPWRTLSFPIC